MQVTLVILVRADEADAQLTVYDLAAQAELAKLKAGEIAGAAEFFSRPSAYFSTDSSTLAFRGPGGKIVLWDAVTKSVRVTLDNMNSVPVLSEDGRFAATSSAEQTGEQPQYRVSIWDSTTRCEVANIAFGAEKVYALALSGDGKLLATAKEKEVTGVPAVTGIEVIELWDVTSGRRLAAIDGDYTLRTTALRFEGQGRMLVARYIVGAHSVWDIQPLPPRPVQPGFFKHVAFSSDGARMAFSNAQEIVNVNYGNAFGGTRHDAPPLMVTIRSVAQGEEERVFVPDFPQGTGDVIGFVGSGQLLAVKGSWMKNRAGIARLVVSYSR